MKRFNLIAAASVVLFASILASALNLTAGGFVPVINRVSAIGVVTLDLSQPGNNEMIALFTIDNNTRSFILTLTFENGGRFVNQDDKKSFIEPYSLKITPANQGTLGDGITPLIDKELLPLSNSQFVWEPKDQSSATVNYGLEILANWYGLPVMSGRYTETIITNIQAIF